jgi:Chaperone of endosialidase
MNRHKQQTRRTRKKEISAMKTIITPHRLLLTILRSRSTFILIAFALAQTAQAVSPPPDGGYAGGNTAEGQNALLSLTTGGFNTAVGFLSLRSDTTGQLNTAIGAGTLFANTGDENTATGAGALLSNTTGFENTAVGAFALVNNIGGGVATGNDNTAVGDRTLFSNTAGDGNTANGTFALFSNTTGDANTANGEKALFSNTTGQNNTALGFAAGSNQTTGSGNVYIGQGMAGVAGENSTCYIASIFGQTSAFGLPVLVNGDNKLGVATSSRRFKEEIQPMKEASEAILALKPVTFRYKKGIDPQGIPQFGLVAEDVEKVNPDLVVRDKEGKPYSVRYDQVNAMLLNEFLKEHKTVQEQADTISIVKANSARQEATIARLEKQIEALTAGLQKVSAQLEASKPAPQVVNNP